MQVALIGAELEENLALRYIHSAITKAGHQPTIFDFHEKGQLDDLVARIVEFNPPLVGLSMVFTARAREFTALVEQLRAAGFRGHITAGGHFASLNAEQLMQDYPGLSSIIHGEGEEVIVDLIENLDRPQSVQSLSFRNDGRLITNQPRPNADNLDARPFPSRPAEFHSYLGLPIANMLSSRGCFGNCSFCSINAWHRRNAGKRFRQRSAEQVGEEMGQLYHDQGVRLFNFHDDNFFLPNKRANLERLEQLRLRLNELNVGRIGIQIKARPDSIDDETVAALERVGLFRVFIGIETNAVAGLKTLGRGITRQQNAAALKILKRRGIHACFNLLMFDPNAQLSDLWENVAFMRRHADFPLNFCRVEVYAGTEIERRLRQENRLLGDYFGYSYRIADQRVQTAYEIFRDVFSPRNFAVDGMNHQAMNIDYHFHILRHFHPRRAVGLQRRVKRLVSELNRNNAELMGRILTFAKSPPGSMLPEVARFTEETSNLREEFDAAMGAKMKATLGSVCERARDNRPSRPGLFATAASVAAATVIATSTGEAAQIGTHPCEIAPGPFEPQVKPVKMPDLFMVEQNTPKEDVGITKPLKEKLALELWQSAAKHRLLGKTVELSLQVDAAGKVNQCDVQLPDNKKNEKLQKEMQQIAEKWQFPGITKPTAGTFSLQLKLPVLAKDMGYYNLLGVHGQIRQLSPTGPLDLPPIPDAKFPAAVMDSASKHGAVGRSVVVYMEIDNTGKVTKCTASLSGKPNDKFIVDLEKQVAAWQFPKIKKLTACTIWFHTVPLSRVIEPPGWEMFEMAPYPFEPKGVPEGGKAGME